MRVSLVQNFLTGIADAGRELLDRRRPENNNVVNDIRSLCIDLLSQQGEALGTALARELVSHYQHLDENAKFAFFCLLRDDFGADPHSIEQAIARYQETLSPQAVLALGQAAEAPRRRLVRAINMAPDGTAAVLAMRRDLLALMKPDKQGLDVVDADFVQPLESWFNRGFLRLERIDWQTPAHILEKLIHYESVHEIQGWDDLRRRLDGDRRCFAFFHPALPDEPLIFVEVALTIGLADAIQPLLDRDSPRGDNTQANTAIFYSINNCQTGLVGISFGNFLIKQVVSELEAELPKLKTFATLSPIPRFNRWLEKVRSDDDLLKYGLNPEQAASLALLEQPNWHTDPAAVAALKKPMIGLCAHYLVREKARNKPMDRVARFHLGNGASLERINWLADTSANGLKYSSGLLVNYLYDLKKIVENHEAFQNDGKIAYSKSVHRSLLVKA